MMVNNEQGQGQSQNLAEILEGKYFEELPKNIQKQLKNTIIQIATVRLKGRKKKVEKTTQNYNLEILKNMVENGEIVLPKFQRGKVWDIKKKSELIYSLLTITIPEIITYEGRDGVKYLLDGWQRVSTIVDYLNNEFKIKLDKNVEHIDPSNESEEVILKSLFERINYKSTPLSKYRIVLLSLITSENYKEMEEKADIINEIAVRIKAEDRQEANLGFIERVLTSYYVLKDWNEKTKEKISKGRSITDILTTVLREELEKEDYDRLVRIAEWIYSLSYLLTAGKPQQIVRKKTNAEIIGLLLAKLSDFEPNIFNTDINLIAEENIEVDVEKLTEVFNLLSDEINALGISPSKNASAYISAIEKLKEVAEIIDWDKIIPDLKEIVKERMEVEKMVEEHKDEEKEVEKGDENKEETKEQKENQGDEELKVW